MNPLEYLDTLIAAARTSEIPVQVSELQMLRAFMLQEKSK